MSNSVRPLRWQPSRLPRPLGFSRQEHWSGLLFPSPVRESEKLKRSCSIVSDYQRLHGLQPTRLLRPWDFPGKGTGAGCHCLLHSSFFCVCQGTTISICVQCISSTGKGCLKIAQEMSNAGQPACCGCLWLCLLPRFLSLKIK